MIKNSTRKRLSAANAIRFEQQTVIRTWSRLYRSACRMMVYRPSVPKKLVTPIPAFSEREKLHIVQ